MQFFVNSVPVCGDTVPLGVQGENLATQITADVSGWLAQWPDGQVIVRLIDADNRSHLADTVVNDGTLVWIVTAADTAQGGYGVGVIELVQGDVVKKTEPFATRVITDPQASGQAPEPVPGWVEETIARMEELEAGAAQSAGAAQTSAGSAQASDQSAQAAAAQAAQSAEDAAAVLRQVETAGAAQVTAIQAAGQQQTQAVTAAGAQQVSAVQTEGADQRAAIEAAGAAQVTAIQAEGQTQQTAIQQKGADTLASIPADYTELSGDVADLKSQIQELATTGSYTQGPTIHYIATEDGQIMSGTNLPVTAPTAYGNRGYHWFTQQELGENIEIDTSLYQYSLAYSNNGKKAGYTAWLSDSPIVFDDTITFTQIGINVKRIDNAALTADDFETALHYIAQEQIVGDLAPKSYAVPANQGAAYAGKVLVVGNDGIVVLGDFPQPVIVDDTLSVSGDAADAMVAGDRLRSIANNGYYSIAPDEEYVKLSSGMITSTGRTDARLYAGYAYLTDEQINAEIVFDATKYKYCLYYEYNGHKVAYPGWVTTSPVVINKSLTFDKVGITLQSLSSTTMSEDDLNTALSYTVSGEHVGQLVTHEQLNLFKAPGNKCIYPDDFTSRIKPDIYYNGKYYAELDAADYKISGSGEVWVATDGDDTNGDGSEANPYATITKALTASVVTVHVKSGTYLQGTHYDNHADFAGKNIIGHGEVVLQNNANGNYPRVTSSAYIENIVFKHGNATTNSAFLATCSASGKTVCFVGCTFRDGGGNGLSVTGIDAVVVGCTAYGNRLDGFNYHDTTVSDVTYTPNVIEIDCTAYNNGTSESGSDSCNGSTAHDGTKIIRLNGEYYSCYGGVIAEIARAGEESTVSVNYGVLAHDSIGTGTYKASFWVSVNTNMYLYDCKSYGGDYDISAINDSKVVSWRMTTGRDEPSVNKGTNATVIQH